MEKRDKARVDQGVSKWWRAAAIVLLIIVISMVAFFAWGLSMANDKALCMNHCYESNYESYGYDYATKQCDCYIGNQIIETTIDGLVRLDGITQVP